jgi:FecR protein
MRVVSARFPALALAILLSISAIATAQTRIGVTSGTSGDPLGKPPAEAERVLRVGVDVKANEAVTTGTADRAHLLFLDGSSLTVGPQAKLTIDKFVYDPATKKGDLALHVGDGVFRFVGGRISKTHPVSIETPNAALTIRGGIMLIDVQPTKTVATFMFGVEMTVIANGVKQTVSRPGWQVTVFSGAAPGKPVQATPGSLSPEFAKLEALRPQPNAGDPDQAVQSSGFEAQNSGRGPTTGPSGPDSGNLSDANNAITGANSQIQRPVFLPQAAPASRGGNQF